MSPFPTARSARLARRSSLLLAMMLTLAGCAGSSARPEQAVRSTPGLPAYAGLELVNATLYQQTAAEYRALTRQVYAQATARLDALLADTAVTAALEQQPPFAAKPPAVIVDVDETLLDNAPFEARLIASGQTFRQEDWGRWVREAAAPEIPGARAFVEACAARNIEVIFLSNRNASEAEATRFNLWRLQFPFSGGLDNFAFRPEDRNDPLYTKGARRKAVADQFRVLMLVGDNLGDFTEAYKADKTTRFDAVDKHQARFGDTWFMLPNAMYGSWEDTLTNFNRDLEDGARHAAKKAHLDPVGLGVYNQPQDR